MAASQLDGSEEQNAPLSLTKPVPVNEPDRVLMDLWKKLAAAPACWFSTVRPDGRAHMAPVWHVWYEDEIFVVTQPKSVRARNIARNSAVSIALPDPMNVLIVEGEARFAPHAIAGLQPLFLEKYGWDINVDAEYTTIIAVTPKKLMAWGTDGEGRWRFDLPQDRA